VAPASATRRKGFVFRSPQILDGLFGENFVKATIVGALDTRRLDSRRGCADGRDTGVGLRVGSGLVRARVPACASVTVMLVEEARVSCLR